MTTAEKRARLLAVVTPTCQFFNDLRGVEALQAASDARIEELWRTTFASWWEFEQRRGQAPGSPAGGAQ